MSDTSGPNDRLCADTTSRHGRRRPAIHDFLCRHERKSWMPTFVGMTPWVQRRWVNLFGTWYDDPYLAISLGG